MSLQQPHNTCTHFVFMAIYEINGNLFTDQTGHFPITSNHCYAYVVVFYIFNVNAIQSIPIKNWSKEELLCAYQEIYEWLTHHSFKPLLHKLDNKTSKDVKAFVTTEQTCIQYTPLDIHCMNPTKLAIRTCEESLSCLHGRTTKIIPHCQLVLTHNAMQCHTQRATSMSSKSSPLGT
jgi:hypothetical protein